MRPINFERTKSADAMYNPKKMALKRTIHVESMTSLFVDQDTFFSSTITSAKNFFIFPIIILIPQAW